MAIPGSAADQLRAEVLAFLVDTPDAKLGGIARACRTSRGEVSRTLDDLIRDGFVGFHHPRPVLRFLFGPLVALFTGAERYSVTKEGYQALMRGAAGVAWRR